MTQALPEPLGPHRLSNQWRSRAKAYPRDAPRNSLEHLARADRLGVTRTPCATGSRSTGCGRRPGRPSPSHRPSREATQSNPERLTDGQCAMGPAACRPAPCRHCHCFVGVDHTRRSLRTRDSGREGLQLRGQVEELSPRGSWRRSDSSPSRTPLVGRARSPGDPEDRSAGPGPLSGVPGVCVGLHVGEFLVARVGSTAAGP